MSLAAANWLAYHMRMRNLSICNGGRIYDELCQNLINTCIRRVLSQSHPASPVRTSSFGSRSWRNLDLPECLNYYLLYRLVLCPLRVSHQGRTLHILREAIPAVYPKSSNMMPLTLQPVHILNAVVGHPSMLPLKHRCLAHRA